MTIRNKTKARGTVAQLAPAKRKMLVATARAAARKAYAPYSSYKVGAALLADDGTVFTGTNVENASYGLSICAERSAVFAAIAGGRNKFTAIAVVTPGRRPASPCGACRQVLAEFCGPDMEIILAPALAPAKAVSTSLGRLLPDSFKLDDGSQERKRR